MHVHKKRKSINGIGNGTFSAEDMSHPGQAQHVVTSENISSNSSEGQPASNM